MNAVADESTAHIQRMVSKQRKSKAKKGGVSFTSRNWKITFQKIVREMFRHHVLPQQSCLPSAILRKIGKMVAESEIKFDVHSEITTSISVKFLIFSSAFEFFLFFYSNFSILDFLKK